MLDAELRKEAVEILDRSDGNGNGTPRTKCDPQG